MSLMNNGTPLGATQYTYDSMSRLATVSNGTNTATYTRATGSNMLTNTAIANGGTTVLNRARAYDNLNRLSQITNSVPSVPSVVKSYSYTYNDKDQRTKITFADGSYWDYTYDDKGQVVSAVRTPAAGSTMPLGATQFGYSFDDIGNRIYADMGMPQMRYNYTSNDLNQYTQMTVPSIIPVTGKAAIDAKVTVTKGSDSSVHATTRDGKYFKAAVPADNTSAKVTENLTINAVRFDATQDKDIVATTTRTGTAEQTPQTFTYDDDGNMLTNSDWTYTWNAQNRLISAEKSDQKLEFAYDYKGRRIYKKVYTGTTGNWTLAAYKKFVYDNFVQIAEYDAMTSDTLKKSYLRDLDESLLSVKNTDSVGNLPAGATLYYNIDGNKNVRSMIDGGGTVVAEYEYSPFGKLIGRRGVYSLENPFRFSSEYHDDETGLVYYNYRYYSTDLGRWLSRDPINEKGGFNLYGMVDNNSIDKLDLLGLVDLYSVRQDYFNYYSYCAKKCKKITNDCQALSCSVECSKKARAYAAAQLKSKNGSIWDGLMAGFTDEQWLNFWGNVIYENGHATIQVGGSVTGGGAVGGTAGDGVAVAVDLANDTYEIGSYFIYGGGSYIGANGSITLDLTLSHNRSINDLAGTSAVAGGSGGVLLSAGCEASVPTDSKASPSFTLSGGAGKGLTPGEVHIFVVNTVIIPYQ